MPSSTGFLQLSEVVRLHGSHSQRYDSVSRSMRLSDRSIESTCLCRPVYKVPAGADGPALPTPPASIAPASSPAPSKVQKNGKKQSNLQAAPNNIARALEFVPGFENQQTDSPRAGHLLSQPSQTTAPDNLYTPSTSHLNRSTHLGPPVSFDTKREMPAPTSSCCSKPPAPTQSQMPKQSSCCGKSSTSQSGPNMKSESDGLIGRELNSMPLPSITPSWQDFNTTEQNHCMTPFTHQPIAQSRSCFPEYNSTTHSGPYTGFQHDDLSGYDFTQASMQPLFSGASQSFTHTPPPATTTDTPHDCNCGDDCQCLGCATHPFNKTTKQHVQQMGAIVSFDEIPNLGDFTGQPNPTFPVSTSANMLDYSFDNFDQQLQNTMPSYPEHTATTTAYSSPPVGYPSEQQLMEASEYYTLEYPVGLPNPCTDLSGSCQCGSDCSCVGCLTHNGHNGVALEPTGTEDFATTAEAPSLKHEQPEDSLSQIPVLDDLSVPSSTPQAIEP